MEAINPAGPHVVVVGGGIAGLATAYRIWQLAQAGNRPLRLTLLESEPRLGGKILTDRLDHFIIEGGPDSFITQKPAALALCRELGLGDRVVGTNDAHKAVFVLNRGRLVPLPEGVLLVVPTQFLPFVLSPLISPLGKLRMGLDLFIRRPPALEGPNGSRDESLASFIRRRLGREALEKIAEPLMAGIHVADPERLSLQATFPRFAEIERRYGSLIRGMLAARKRRSSSPDGQREAGKEGPRRPPPGAKTTVFMTLQGGLLELVETLAARLEGTSLLTGCRVTQLAPSQPWEGGAGPAVGGKESSSPGTGWRVSLEDGRTMWADAVILALPAFAAADLVQDLDPTLASALRGIRYVTTATVSLAYRREECSHPLNGFGFVVPTPEARRILACTWTSTKFPHRAPSHHVLLRCFIGGAQREDLAEQEDAALETLAREELRDILGVTATPVLTRVYRWPRGNPQYDVGHLDRVAEMEAMAARHAGLFLTGSAFRGIGLPDCIAQGEATAHRVMAYLQTL